MTGHSTFLHVCFLRPLHFRNGPSPNGWPRRLLRVRGIHALVLRALTWLASLMFRNRFAELKGVHMQGVGVFYEKRLNKVHSDFRG